MGKFSTPTKVGDTGVLWAKLIPFVAFMVTTKPIHWRHRKAHDTPQVKFTEE